MLTEKEKEDQNSPGKNTGVCCHVFLQGIFPTQGWNQVSHIAGRFFTSWAATVSQDED